MHILFITPAYPPFPGGGERYAHSLAQALVERGHFVTAVTSHAQTEQELWLGTTEKQIITESLDGVTVIRCPIRPFPGGRSGLLAWRKAMVLLSMLPGSQTAALQRMAQFIPPFSRLEQTLAHLPDRFDLVHGFNLSWEYAALAGWQYARQHQLPFVVTPFIHLGTGQDRVARNSTMDHQLHLMRDASRVLTLTAVEKEGLAELGIPQPQIDVIGGGLDPLPPLPDTDELLRRLGVQLPFVICLGRASYEKGTIHAAQAVLALRQQGSPVSLVQVGQTSPEFNRFLSRLDDGEREGIRPLDILNDSEKHGLLSQASALLLPSRTDSFGIVLLEAWAHGKPVIGARAGGIPSVIDDEQSGLLVTFGDVSGLADAITRLLTDSTLNQQIGRQGQRKVKTTYTWDKVADRVLKNYHTALNAQQRKQVPI